MRFNPHLISRLRWEREEIVKIQKRLPVRIQSNIGVTYQINCFIPSIQYAKPKLVQLYQSGGFFDLLELVSHKLFDSDLKLIPPEEPVVLKAVLHISDVKGVEKPEVEVLSPICHPHVVGRMCLGENWTPDRSFASMLPGILDCLLFKPGTYRLLDALNPSAARYFQEQTHFKLPLEGLR